MGDDCVTDTKLITLQRFQLFSKITVRECKLG